jgi:hypothetical protein
MALLWTMGFDYWRSAADVALEGAAGSQQLGAIGNSMMVPGRYGGQALSLANASSNRGEIVREWLGGTTELYLVGNLRLQGSAFTATEAIISLFEGGAYHFAVALNTSRQIVARRGTTVLATSSNALALDQWYQIQVRVLVADSGSYEIRIDGSSSGWLSASADTRNAGATGICTRVFFAAGAHSSGLGRVLWDDLALWTSSGDAPNTWLSGAHRIETLRPSSLVSAQFTPTTPTGANLTNVNAGILNPGDWNASTTVGHVDRYAMGNLAGTPTAIHAVGLKTYASRPDSGAREMRQRLHSGATTSNGGTFTPSQPNGAIREDYWTLDPDTSAAWDASGVNGIEVSQEVVS